MSTKSLRDAPRSGASARLTLEGRDLIDALLNHDDELTSKQIKIMLQRELNISVCESTIRRVVRTELHWVVTKPRYCQTIRDLNKTKRLGFVQQLLASNDNFKNIIFSDESSVEMIWHKKICRRKKGVSPKLKPKPKHPLKVHVWGGISCRGATPICVFTGTMVSDIYTKILSDHLLPFIQKAYPTQHRFMQDNDPKHVSRHTKQFLQDRGINWWPTPPESPDLNPIEKVWNEMKRFLESEVKPFTKNELVTGILEFWRTRMTPHKCQTYISHLSKVLPKVVEAQGGPTGE